MPILEKNMQKKEKDTCSKDETVSDCFQENKTRIFFKGFKTDDLTALNAGNQCKLITANQTLFQSWFPHFKGH